MHDNVTIIYCYRILNLKYLFLSGVSFLQTCAWSTCGIGAATPACQVKHKYIWFPIWNFFQVYYKKLKSCLFTVFENSFYFLKVVCFMSIFEVFIPWVHFYFITVCSLNTWIEHIKKKKETEEEDKKKSQLFLFFGF